MKIRKTTEGIITLLLNKDARVPQEAKKRIVMDLEVSFLWNELCFRCTADRTTPVSGN